jgi:hypothetical protein
MTEQQNSTTDYAKKLENDPRLGMTVKALSESRQFGRDVLGSIKVIRQFADGQEIWSVLCDQYIIVDAHSSNFEFMENKNMPEQQSITAEYEQKALDAFVDWYQQANPTIGDASTQAYVIANKITLTALEVILLLQEHPDWIFQRPHESNRFNVALTIGDVTCGHLAVQLRRVIEEKGMQAVYSRKESKS